MSNFDSLPDSAFLRLADLARSPQNPTAILPFSGATVWRKVAAGEFPAPVRFGSRVTAWNVGTIRAYLENGGEVAA